MGIAGLVLFTGAAGAWPQASAPSNRGASAPSTRIYREPTSAVSVTVLHGVTVTQSNQSIIINVNAGGPVRVTTSRMSAPERIVIDLEGARYFGRTLHMPVRGGNLLEVRLSQFEVRPAVARIVLVVTRRMPFEVVYFPHGLAIQVNTGEGEDNVARAAVSQVAAGPVAAISIPAPASVPPAFDIGQLHPPISHIGVPGLPVIPPAPSPPTPTESLTQDEQGPTTPHQAAKANIPTLVNEVTVSRQKGAVDVRIEANGQLRPTARLVANPDRIVVDLANAYCDRTRRITVHSAEVKEVEVSLFLLNPPVTRIVVALGRPHDYHLIGSGNSLIIRVEAREVSPAAITDSPVTLLREPATK